MTRERLGRLLLFPLLLCYAAVLIVAGWPRLLTSGRAMAAAQLGANWVLAQLAWPAGLTVFSGQDDRQQVALASCFRLVGVAAPAPGAKAPEAMVLFDTMAACRDARRDVLKDPLEVFLTRTLGTALSHLRTPGAHDDRNRYPLNELFAIADYYCHKDGASFARVAVTARYQQRRLADGEQLDVTIDEGVHHCAEGVWQPLGFKHRIR